MQSFDSLSLLVIEVAFFSFCFYFTISYNAFWSYSPSSTNSPQSKPSSLLTQLCVLFFLFLLFLINSVLCCLCTLGSVAFYWSVANGIKKVSYHYEDALFSFVLTPHLRNRTAILLFSFENYKMLIQSMSKVLLKNSTILIVQMSYFNSF